MFIKFSLPVVNFSSLTIKKNYFLFQAKNQKIKTFHTAVKNENLGIHF